jgi:tetratricopeptide (TPR) repeat protein
MLLCGLPFAGPAWAQQKPITQIQVFTILALHGPAGGDEVARQVKERGIDFEPTEDCLKEVRLAGGGDGLIWALKGAIVAKPERVDPALQAHQAEIRQHVAQAAKFMSEAQYADAGAEFRKAIRLEPQNADLHLTLAVALLANGDLDGAIEEERETLRLNPNNDDAHAYLGRALSNKGDWDGAIAEAREALRLNPKNGDAHDCLESALRTKKDWDGLIVEEREALRLNPNNSLAHLQLGEALAKKGDWDEAIAEYREALRLNPNYWFGHLQFGEALARKGDWDGAIAEYREVIRLNPNNENAHAYLGATLGIKGDLDGAIAEEREALRLNPNNDGAHADLGWALARKENLDGAIAEYREALRLNPKNEAVHADLGWALAKKGDWDGANAEEREALRLNPKTENAHSDLGAARGNQAEAGHDDAARVLGESQDSVALILAGGSLPLMQGTGFFVRSSGLLLTNFHVINGMELVGVKLPGAKTISWAKKAKGYDTKNDLVALVVDTGAVKPLRLGNSDEVYVGEQIIVVSNPEGLVQTVSNGLVSGIRDFGGRKLFQISAPISRGSSGAPVFNAHGEVIGVVARSVPSGQNLNFAVPINYAKPLLDSPEETLISSLARQMSTSRNTISVGAAPPSPERTPTNVHAEGRTIDFGSLSRELMQMSQTPDGQTMVMWLPRELWLVTAQKNANVPAAVLEAVTKAVSHYTIIGALEGKVGASGNIAYATETDLAARVKLKDANGTLYSPLSQDQIDSGTGLVLAALKPTLAKMPAPLGENMQFFVFPAQDKSGQAIAEATKDGVFFVEVGEKEFRWRLPLGALAPSTRYAPVEIAAQGQATPGTAAGVAISSNGPSNFPTVQLKLESVRFFESGSKPTPKDERKYAIRFKQSSTRMVAYELELTHPRPESQVNFDIETLWYDPANNLTYRYTFHAFVPAGSARSLHAGGWGCPEHPCSRWLKGTYHVDFIMGETKLGTGTFEIH